jgi:hypothetical protein
MGMSDPAALGPHSFAPAVEAQTTQERKHGGTTMPANLLSVRRGRDKRDTWYVIAVLGCWGGAGWLL